MDFINIDRCHSTEPYFEIEVPSQSDEERIYTVMIPFPDDWIEDFACECLGYLNRGRCKHQDIAASMLCRWDEQEGPEKQTDDQRRDRICPRCGEPTIRSVEVA